MNKINRHKFLNKVVKNNDTIVLKKYFAILNRMNHDMFLEDLDYLYKKQSGGGFGRQCTAIEQVLSAFSDLFTLGSKVYKCPRPSKFEKNVAKYYNSNDPKNKRQLIVEGPEYSKKSSIEPNFDNFNKLRRTIHKSGFPSIFIITFNTEAKQYKQLDKCSNFFDTLKSEADDSDIIAICLQESSRLSDNILESFQKCFSKNNYSLIESPTLMSIGKEGYRGLKTYILIKKDYKDVYHVEISKEDAPSAIPTKGSICVLLKNRFIGNIAIMNSHLPFKKSQYPNQGLEQRNQMFEYYYNGHRDRLRSDFTNSFKFFVGDLNYRNNHIMKRFKSKNAKIFDSFYNNFIEEFIETKHVPDHKEIYKKIYKDYDQLYQQLIDNSNTNKIINQFTEGIRDKYNQNGEGITFPFSCKLKKNRKPTNTGKEKYDSKPDKYYRIPSWCDRILYSKDLMEVEDKFSQNKIDNKYIICQEYNILDEKLITQSDHALVYGKYKIKFDEQPLKIKKQSLEIPRDIINILNEYNYKNGKWKTQEDKENFIDNLIHNQGKMRYILLNDKFRQKYNIQSQDFHKNYNLKYLKNKLENEKNKNTIIKKYDIK